jgi:hypothetical protein
VTAAQIVQVIVLVAQLTGQPAELMVELARAESGLVVDALGDRAALTPAALAPAAVGEASLEAGAPGFGEAVEAGASGGLFCFKWETAQWTAGRVGLEIGPEDLANPWVNAFLAAKVLEWGYGGWFHAMERVPAHVRPEPDDAVFRRAPMWEAGR